MNEIDAMVKQILDGRAAAIETTCEKAIQGGVCGVLVIDGPGAGQWSVRVDPAVPYGQIHYRGEWGPI